MTPLEQFNEEVIKEFDQEFNPWFTETIRPDRETKKNIGYFFIEKLAAHKELILKMVREKVPMIKRGYGRDCQECEDFIDGGDNSCMCLEFNRRNQQFLNNLDTL